MQHYPDITIKENIVDIAVYTKDLNDITDVDIEMIKKINDIVEDILHIDF
jgi:pterin-4a-carbinolamine dehydratase